MAYNELMRSRNRDVRKLLAKEFALAKHYRAELDDNTILLSPEEQAYKQRVVSAATRTLGTLSDEKQRFAKAVFVDYCRTLDEICFEYSIATQTYYRWRADILKTFGIFVGLV